MENKCSNVGCNETFKYRMQRKRHMERCKFPKCAIKIKGKEKFEFVSDIYKCKKCKKIIKNVNNISRHLKECDLKPVTPVPKHFPCTECSKVFKYPSKLKEHSVVHIKEMLSCIFCGKTFINRKDVFRKHVEKCGDNETFPSFVSTSANKIHDDCHDDCQQGPSVSHSDIDIYIGSPFSPLSDTINYEIRQAEHNDSLLEQTFHDLQEKQNLVEILVVYPIDPVTPPRVKQYRSAKKIARHTLKVDNILSNVEKNEKEKILRRSMNCEMNTFTEATLDYFKNIVKNARQGHHAKVEAAQLFTKVFGDHLWNYEFQLWLVNMFNLRDIDELCSFLEYQDKEVSVGGRQMLPLSVRQLVYDFWKVNSQVSTYRSNNRHFAKITKSNVLPQQVDVIDSDVQESENNVYKLECHRKFLSETYRRMHKLFSDTSDIQFTFTSFMRLKPFYVKPVAVKEMETCLCIICVNNHCVYNAIRRNIKRELPRSLTEYLCGIMKFEKNSSIKFDEIECISGTCSNKCQIRNTVTDFKEEVKEANTLKNKISYYMFEPVTTYYFNKNGEKVSYDRTTRVDKQETLEQLVVKLHSFAHSYLTHRFLEVNDTFYWKHFSLCGSIIRRI